MSTYQDLIHEIAPHLNPAGVEACMRLQFSTLSHLCREDFVTECEIAEACEQGQPGFLKATAATFGLAEDFEKWEVGQ